MVERSRSSFLPAFLFLTAPQRDALYAVYAFLRAVDDAVDGNPPAVARPLVTHLVDELNAAFTGAATDPAAARLAEVMVALGMERELLDRILTGLESDLLPARIETFDELRAYAALVAGNLGVFLLPVFAVRPGAESRHYAHELGTALQLVNIARDVGEDARRGRCYVPGALLREHGADAADVLAGRDTPAVRGALRELRRRARIELSRARALLPRASRIPLCVPEIMADIYSAQLAMLDRAGGSPFLGPMPRIRRRRGLALASWRYAVTRMGRWSMPDAT